MGDGICLREVVTMRELTTTLVCRDFLTKETPHGTFLVSDHLT